MIYGGDEGNFKSKIKSITSIIFFTEDAKSLKCSIN